MKYGGLIVENKEYDKLIQLMGMARNRKDETYQASISKILSELVSAQLVSADAIPDDVVRFNSVVEISFPNGTVRTIEVVTPERGNVAANKISILAPMGLALFGYAATDEIMWQFPSGMQAIKILKVRQFINDQKKVKS